ncbi:MAG: hypothetical protein F6J93_18590 [Oscillatoria sp. SIO1A7]|nr:hypothetical protein [Oscillatoria sp. SIO1A7]
MGIGQKSSQLLLPRWAIAWAARAAFSSIAVLKLIRSSTGVASQYYNSPSTAQRVALVAVAPTPSLNTVI